MDRASPEHFEMAATAFHSAGRLIDPELCEKFADILARESAGHSAVVHELSELQRAVMLIHDVVLKHVEKGSGQ